MPAKTRHNEVAPGPVRDRADLRGRQRRRRPQPDLTMEVAQRSRPADTAWRCLLHEKPFAGVNGSRQAQQLVAWRSDDGNNLLDPGNTPHEQRRSSWCSCVAVIRRRSHQHADLLRGHRRHRGQRPPARRQRGAAGHHLHLPRRTARRRFWTTSRRARRPRRLTSFVIDLGVDNAARRSCDDNTDRNRTSPFAFTGAQI
ncbi:MAG: hypothetical protein MZU84_02190 [Sphingobacterium sp.]|nr:hypothetical protein [Sphingobacterium sp.]